MAKSTSQPEFERLCDAFEASWKSGHRPVIEEYLQRVEETERATLLALLLQIDFSYRRQINALPSASEYKQRFAEYVGVIESMLESHAAAALPDTAGSSPTQLSTITFMNRPGNGDHDELEADPDRIAHFEIEQLLGRGGFGSVYQAYDTQLNRRVAIKGPSIRSWNRLKEKLQERFESEGARRIIDEFRDEARKAAGLRHHGIVVIHEFRVEDDRPYIVQELIDGWDLESWAREKKPDFRRIVEIVTALSILTMFGHDQVLVTKWS